MTRKPQQGHIYVTKKNRRKIMFKTNMHKSPSFRSGGESKQGTDVALQSKMTTYIVARLCSGMK